MPTTADNEYLAIYRGISGYWVIVLCFATRVCPERTGPQLIAITIMMRKLTMNHGTEGPIFETQTTGVSKLGQMPGPKLKTFLGRGIVEPAAGRDSKTETLWSFEGLKGWTTLNNHTNSHWTWLNQHLSIKTHQTHAATNTRHMFFCAMIFCHRFDQLEGATGFVLKSSRIVNIENEHFGSLGFEFWGI